MRPFALDLLTLSVMVCGVVQMYDGKARMRAEKVFALYSTFVALAVGIFATSYIPYQRSIGLTNGEIFFVEAIYSLSLLI